MTLLPDVTSWTSERIEATFGRHDVWDPAVRAICSRECIAPDRITPGFKASSASFLLDDSLVLKIYPPGEAETEPIEAMVLSHLEDEPSVPTPRIYSRGILEDRHPWPYLIMEQMRGMPVREAWPHMSTSQRRDLARQAAALVYAMHTSITASLESPLTGLGKGWDETRDEIGNQRHEMITAILDLSSKMDELPLARPVWDQLARFLRDLPLPEPPHRVLVHRDLTEDHLYVQQTDTGWSIAGLIDFGDVAIGPARLDWNDLRFHMFNREIGAMKAFLHAYHGSLESREDLTECFALTAGGVGFFDWLTVLVSVDHLKTMTSLAELKSALWPEELTSSKGWAKHGE